ncbi:hypothetical protein AURDEDRAFT_179482 [Auricularia subglabra TFB-10046 SS5]|nr:hypothetical protein AURDEDRAFT_179482 [Auricularia subglabra TFB-10046 SS5]
MPPKRKRAVASKKAKADGVVKPNEQTVGSGKAPAATLIVELLDRIFALVAGRYWEPIFTWLNSDEFVTSKRKIGLPLVHIARVNKHWHSIALRQLYRTVVICNPDSMRLLARALKGQPSCAFTDYFHSFTIEYWYKNLPSDPEKRKLEAQARQENSTATWEVIPHIKKLHHFGLSSSSLDPIPRGREHPSVPGFLQGLKSLSLREDNWSHFLYSKWIFAAAPTLERFRAPSYAVGGAWPGCPPMVHLRSLCTHQPDGSRLSEIGPAFNPAAGAYGRLEDLSIRCTSVDASHILGVSGMMRCIAPTIRRLHLGLSFARDGNAVGPVYDALAAALPAALNLHTVSLLIFRAPLLDDRAALVGALPGSVHTLTLRQGHPNDFNVIRSPGGKDPLTVYGDEAEAVLARVDRGELKALKTFTMAGKLYACDRIYDYYAKERKVFARRQTQLMQSAKKLAVKLSFVKDVEDHLSWYYPS